MYAEPDPLFQPVTIGRLELPNRICMPAMHLGMAQRFAVTDRLVGFYRERARGGAALIVAGFATVDRLSGFPTCIGAHDDAHLPGLSRLAAAIQAEGARAALQLNHAGRYNYSFLLEKGQHPVAPSAVTSPISKETPRALEPEEIAEIVRAFGAAARRVKQASFAAVELLAGTGYLISEFLSPLTNRREDGYGGAFENRARFGLEVLRATKEAVGPDLPVIVRINGNDFVPGGIGRAELGRFAELLVEAGADALHVNVGWHEAPVPQIVSAVPRGMFAYLARAIRQRVSVPVIASHRIATPEVGRQLLRSGACDLVAMGRALIADPQLPARARRGEEGEIVPCVACGQGCFDRILRLRPVECLCNPRAGHEEERPLVPAAVPRRVLVVGGGPAGMSAALAAAQRGHRVVLYEAQRALGGQLLPAARPPGRQELRELVSSLERRLVRQGVRLELGQRLEPEQLDAEQPELVVLASGATPLLPGWAAAPASGPSAGDAPGPDVVQAWDVLADRAATGRRVVVAGGGAVGVETALLLATQGTLSAEELRFLLVHRAEPAEELLRLASRGCKEVVLVELRQKLGEGLGASTRWVLLEELKRVGVQRRTATRIVGLDPGGVRVQPVEEAGAAATVEEIIPADTVVLALGARSYDPLREAVLQRGIALRVVGDAARVGDAFQAVHQGFLAGAEL